MRHQEIAEKAQQILLAYYNNDIMPFLSACHDDVMWIGPAKGQYIQGKAKLVAAFGAEKNPLRFSVEDLAVTPVPTSSASVWEVVMHFLVDTYYPDGSTNRADQRIVISMVDCLKDPKILICHISNGYSYDERDSIYPVHYNEMLERRGKAAAAPEAMRLCLRGPARTELYLDKSSVTFFESHDRHTTVHTLAREYESIETLASIAKRYGDMFVRTHVSYLVNPDFVRNVERFKITLFDGTTVPVPEKRYTAIRTELARRIVDLPAE
jgi:hypothetical protein